MTRPDGLKTGSVDIGNGVQIYYEECGTGPALLLVHGMWGSCRFFHKQMRDLSTQYRVIALDLRGHGRSSMTTSDQTVPTYARDVYAFVKAIALESFVAVGWSMGAFVWWDYYQQFGIAGVRGLVVVDQPPSDWQSQELPNALISVEVLKLWHYRLQTERNALIREVIPMMFATQLSDADMEWMTDEMTRAPETVAAATMVDQSLREYQHTLWDYPVPTLVCAGGKSAQPADGHEMTVKRCRDARLITFENSGHCLFLEDAERFNREVDLFVSALPRGIGNM